MRHLSPVLANSKQSVFVRTFLALNVATPDTTKFCAASHRNMTSSKKKYPRSLMMGRLISRYVVTSTGVFLVRASTTAS